MWIRTKREALGARASGPLFWRTGELSVVAAALLQHVAGCSKLDQATRLLRFTDKG